MTLIALTDCCRLLAIDGKTLRRWLAQADVDEGRREGQTTIDAKS